jgi:hypothetical protein
MYAGNGKHLSAHFKALFDRTCAYRLAKNVADNRREQGVLAELDVAREEKAKKEFVDAYRLSTKTMSLAPLNRRAATDRP